MTSSGPKKKVQGAVSLFFWQKSASFEPLISLFIVDKFWPKKHNESLEQAYTAYTP